MIMPATMILFLKVLSPLAGRSFGLMGTMATRGTSASLSRTAVAITALAVAISISVGIGTMVQSFKGTVERWLDTSLAADHLCIAAVTPQEQSRSYHVPCRSGQAVGGSWDSGGQHLS